MRHCLFTAVLATCLCAGISLRAQYYTAPTPPDLPIVDVYGATINQILDSMYAHANPYDTTEGGEMDQIRQFRLQWEGRVYANDSSGTNMFKQYYQMLKSAAAAKLTSGTCGDGTWRCIGAEIPGTQISGYLTTIWASSDSNYLLAGTQGGLFKSTNAGATWHCVTDNTTLAGPAMIINCIAVHPINDNIVFIGTNGGGILKSTDAGNTWSTENIAADGERINKLFFTPDGVRIYAFLGSSIFTRLTTGSTWTDITPSGSDGATWKSMQFVPGDRTHIFVSSQGINTGIWETTDSIGTSGWTKITAGLYHTIGGIYTSPTGWRCMDISIPSADTLYLIAMDSLSCVYPIYICPKAAMFKYNISGTSHAFTLLYNDLPYDRNPSTFKFQIIVSPANPNNIYYATDVPYAAYNRSSSMVKIGTYDGVPTHGDIRFMHLQSSTSEANGKGDRLYLATDGGASQKPAGRDVAANGTSSTTDISGHGLYCGTYWQYSSGQGNYGIGTMMHDGIVSQQPDLPQPWHSILMCDAWGCEVDKSDNERAYVSQGFGSVGFERTIEASGRKMGGYEDYIQPSDPSFDNLGVGAPMTTDNYGSIYFLKNSLWRKKTTDLIYNDAAFLGYGTPVSPTLYGARIAINPSDTSFNGYLLYNTSDWHVQQIYYRHRPAVDPAVEITGPSPVPGSSTYHMNAIITDPNNTERVWVGEGEINNNTYAHTRYRILYSANHGSTWVDVSNGLPQKLPITDIVFDEATNMLYAGTDLGVYRCNFSNYNATANYTNSDGVLENDGVTWTCFSQGAVSGANFPNIGAGLTINHCRGKLYASTFGRSVWESDLYSGSDVNPTPITISSNTTWGADMIIPGDVKVVTGATLTITGATIHMPKDGKIIVERGAKLVVDHSTITNGCAECMWGGITAIGSIYYPQVPASNQGWVVINNSVIEHAKTGATSYLTSDTDRSGGIIQVNSSMFRDCETAADFGPYGSATGGLPTPDLSYFNNVTFLLDGAYKGSAIPPMPAQVHLWKTDGVRFTACKFLKRTNNYVGDGIRAEDAGFIVQPFCTMPAAGCVILDRSRFCGFVNAVSIKRKHVYDSRVINIDRTDFDSVSVGVNSSVQDNVSVTRSDFKIGTGPTIAIIPPVTTPEGCGRNVGIIIQNAKVFKMEGNSFKGKDHAVPMTPWYNIGCIVANSGATNSKVYRNTYDSLATGVLAIGNNYTDKLPYGGYGLRILCNSFSNGDKDIVVTGNGATPGEEGIAWDQGTATASAGNLFYSSSAMNIYNTTLRTIHYYYEWSVPGEEASTSGYVTEYSTAGPSVCTSTIPDPLSPPVYVTGGHPPPLRALHHTFDDDKATLAMALGAYGSAIDFGNTSALLEWMNGETTYGPTDSTLTAGSPFLSTTVLMKLIEKWSAHHTDVLAILMANPDALGDQELVGYATDAMSLTGNEHGALLWAATAAATNRTTLETTIQDLTNEMADAANELLFAYETPADTNVAVNDTTWGAICLDSNSVYYTLDSNAIYWGLDSLDGMLQDIGGSWTDYARAGYYVYKGRYDIADSIMAGIDDYIQSEGQTSISEYDSYTHLWGVQKNAYDNGRDVYHLNATDYSTLDTSGTGEPTPFAGVALKLNFKKVVTFEYPCAYYAPLPKNGESSGSVRQQGDAGQWGVDNLAPPAGRFRLYPNPTKGTFTVLSRDNGMLTVYTIEGREVTAYRVAKGANEQALPKGLSPGVYMCRYTSENGGTVMVRLVYEK